LNEIKGRWNFSQIKRAYCFWR